MKRLKTLGESRIVMRQFPCVASLLAAALLSGSAAAGCGRSKLGALRQRSRWFTPMVWQHRSTSIVIFLTTMVVGGSLLLSAGVQEGALTWWTVRLTQLSGAALEALGFAVRWNARALGTSDGSFTTFVGNGCNGAWAHLIFLASVLAYAATWKQKLLGLAIGQPLLLLLNLVRIISLFIVGVYAPAMFRAAHVYVWQFLIIGFAMLLLFIWADRFVRTPA